MKFLVYFISFIIFYILPKTYSQNSQKVPGPSSCTYYASILEDCGEQGVPASDLPEEATSIFYEGLEADVSLNVSFSYPTTNNDAYIKDLLSTGKQVFLYYKGQTFNTAKDEGKNTQTEISNLKKALEPYKDITGILLSGFTFLTDNTTTASLTDNFKTYLDEMRSTFPDYGIGLSINGKNLTKMFAKPIPPIWYDFNELSHHADFYVINLLNLNKCTDELKVGGITPISGSAPRTIDQVQCYVKQLGIPREESYYMYPISLRMVGNKNPQCNLTYAKICAKPNFDGLCVENTQSLYDKGKFAKENGVGFIVMDVDIYDDPYDCCRCGAPYPTFHRILAGFNDDPAPPVCPSFDKP